MQIYQDLLRITETIEHTLKNNTLEAMPLLQKERQMIFEQLQIGSIPDQPKKVAALIRLIRGAEDRCTALAVVKKKNLAKEMGATGRAKKLHTAYGRQALA